MSSRRGGPVGTTLDPLTLITLIRGKGKGKPRLPKVHNWSVHKPQCIFAYVCLSYIICLSILKIMVHVHTSNSNPVPPCLFWLSPFPYLWLLSRAWETFINLFIWSVHWAHLPASLLWILSSLLRLQYAHMRMTWSLCSHSTHTWSQPVCGCSHSLGLWPPEHVSPLCGGPLYIQWMPTCRR